MQLEQGIQVTVDQRSLSQEEESHDQYHIIHIVESSNGDETSKEPQPPQNQKPRGFQYEPSSRKLAFDSYMVQKEVLEKLLTSYLQGIPKSSKLQKFMHDEKIKMKQQNYLKKQMYSYKNQKSRKDLQQPNNDLMQASRAQLHVKENQQSAKKNWKSIVINSIQSPRGPKHDGFLNPSYNLKLEPTLKDDEQDVEDDLLKIAQILKDGSTYPKVTNADLDAIELKETEKLIENIMSMQVRITEEANELSKDELESKTREIDFGTAGTLVNPTPRRTFTLANDITSSPNGNKNQLSILQKRETVDHQHQPRERSMKISTTTVQLGIDSSIQQEQTLQSPVNLTNRDGSAQKSREFQANLIQATPKMRDEVIKRNLRVLSLEQHRSNRGQGAASISIGASSHLSQFAAIQSPLLRPIHASQVLIDENTTGLLTEKNQTKQQNQDLLGLKVKKEKQSPFISGQAITLQTMVQSNSRKKLTKQNSASSIKSIKELQKVSSKLNQSNSKKSFEGIQRKYKSPIRSPLFLKEQADWQKGRLVDITDVVESKQGTQHGSMGGEMKMTGSIAQTKTKLQVEIGGAQTPQSDLLIPFAGRTTDKSGSVPHARMTEGDSFIQNKLESYQHASQASPQQYIHLGPDGKPTLYNSLNNSSTHKQSLQRGSQRNSGNQRVALTYAQKSKRSSEQSMVYAALQIQDVQINQWPQKHSPKMGEFSFKELTVPTAQFESSENSHLMTRNSPVVNQFQKSNEGLRSPKNLNSQKMKQLGGKSRKVKTIQEVLDQYINKQTKQVKKQQEIQKYAPQKMQNLRKQELSKNANQFYVNKTVVSAAQQNQISNVYQMLEKQLSETNDVSPQPATADGKQDLNNARNASQSSLISQSSDIQIEGQVVDIKDMKKEEKEISKFAPLNKKNRGQISRNNPSKRELSVLEMVKKNRRGSIGKETLSDEQTSHGHSIRLTSAELEAQKELEEMVKILEQQKLGLEQSFHRMNSQSVLDQVHLFEAQLEGKQRSQSIIFEKKQNQQSLLPAGAYNNQDQVLIHQVQEREESKESGNIRIGSQIINKSNMQLSPKKNYKKDVERSMVNIEDLDKDNVRAQIPIRAELSSFEVSKSKDISFTPWKGQTQTDTGQISPAKIHSLDKSKLTTLKSKISVGTLKVPNRQSKSGYISKDDDIGSNKDIIQIMNMKANHSAARVKAHAELSPQKVPEVMVKTLVNHEDQGNQILYSSLAGSSPHLRSSMNIRSAIKTQSTQENVKFLVKDKHNSSFQATFSQKDIGDQESGLQVFIPATSGSQIQVNKRQVQRDNKHLENELVAVQSEMINSQDTSWQAKAETLDAGTLPGDTAEGQQSIIYSKVPSKRNLQDLIKNNNHVDSSELRIVSQSDSITLIQSMKETQRQSPNFDSNQGLPSLSAQVLVGSPGENSQVAVTFQPSPRDFLKDDNQFRDGQVTLQSSPQQSEQHSQKSEKGNYQNYSQNYVKKTRAFRLEGDLETGETYKGNSQDASQEVKVKPIKTSNQFSRKPSFVTFQTNNSHQVAQSVQHTEPDYPDYLKPGFPLRKKRNQSQFQVYIKDKLRRIEEGRLSPSLKTPPHGARVQRVPWNKKLSQIIGMPPLESQNTVPFPTSISASERKFSQNLHLMRRKESLGPQLSEKLRSMRVYSTLAHGDEGKQPNFDMSKAFRNFRHVRTNNEQLKFELGLLKDGQMPQKLGLSPSGLNIGQGTGAMLALRTKEITETLIERQRNQLIGKDSLKTLQTKHISLPKLKRQGIPIVQSNFQ